MQPAVERRPVAPAWFDAALAQAPERTHLEVEGAEIEVLIWGERGQPGLLLLHGFTAHADWWSFIAPLLRQGRESSPFRCPAWAARAGATPTRSSSTPVKRSPWRMRPACSTRPSPPILIGHSFGSFATRIVAHTLGTRLGGIVAGRRRTGRERERRRIRRRSRAGSPAPGLPDARTGDCTIPLRARAVLRQPLHHGFPCADVARTHAGRARR